LVDIWLRGGQNGLSDEKDSVMVSMAGIGRQTRPIVIRDHDLHVLHYGRGDVVAGFMDL
jgi:regulator of extracellular matrix RemA (YlzA/DUF370 family)